MIIDDNRLFSTQLAKYLREHGHESETACCKKGALDLLSQGDYDICIVETHIGNEEGFDIIKSITHQYPDVHIFPMTKSTDHGIHSHQELLDHSNLLRKPITGLAVIETINKFMEDHR